MGNLDDLRIARENNDVEYLKEWSQKAVKAHGVARDIQLDLFKELIRISEESAATVQTIKQRLSEA